MVLRAEDADCGLQGIDGTGRGRLGGDDGPDVRVKGALSALNPALGENLFRAGQFVVPQEVGDLLVPVPLAKSANCMPAAGDLAGSRPGYRHGWSVAGDVCCTLAADLAACHQLFSLAISSGNCGGPC
jgi:hypothetical protein